MPDWSYLQTFADTLPNNPRPDLSELDKALILSALSFIEDRDVWEDMTDIDWDILEAKLAEVAERVG